MSNSSILASFERMWKHIKVQLEDYATKAFVINEIEDLDLGNYATKEDVNEVSTLVGDTPVSEQVNRVIDKLDGLVYAEEFGMATGKVKTLYSDKEKTEALFPRTKTKAISDDNGMGLDAILDSLATESFVQTEIAKVKKECEDIDLSNYATKDDVKNIDYPVDSVNGKIGAVTLSASDVGAAPKVTEKFTPAFSSQNAAPTDMLSIDLNGNFDASSNLWAGHVSTEDASTLRNFPITSGAFYGFRTVEKSPVGHFLVTVKEMYPVAGRIWSHMYDINSGWRGWQVLDTKDKFLPLSGGTMNGWLTFDGTVGPEWTTADGTRFAVRAYNAGNLFQITTRPPGGGEQATFNIGNDGKIWFGDPAAVRSSIEAQAKLGFNPIQQGGGTNMTGNKVYIGWSNDRKLLAQVDDVSMGAIVTTGGNNQAIVPVSKGGTGATDAATALNNLGANPKIITHSFWADIGRAESGTFSCIGNHIVTNYGNGLFRVLFHGSVQTVVATDTYNYGIDVTVLRNLINSTFGTSFTNLALKSSTIDAWRYSDGLYAKGGAGFGYCFQRLTAASGDYLEPARIYTREGAMGGWEISKIHEFFGDDAMVNYELWLQLS